MRSTVPPAVYQEFKAIVRNYHEVSLRLWNRFIWMSDRGTMLIRVVVGINNTPNIARGDS